MNAAGREGLSPAVLVLLFIWPLVVAGVLAFGGKRYVDERFAQRPPIVFLDELKAVTSERGEGTPEERSARAIERARAAGELLAAEGYVVLQARSVYAAPEYTEVEP